jgi:HSP20 family protein
VEVFSMTAHRPRKTGPLEEGAFPDSLFTSAHTPGSGWLLNRRTHVWRPPTDVYETEDQIVVQVEIAGVRQADFAVTLDDRRLTVSGVRHDPSAERRAYHQLEVHVGEFCTEVDLPGPVDDAAIEAEYSDGFLRVILPRAGPRRPGGE